MRTKPGILNRFLDICALLLLDSWNTEVLKKGRLRACRRSGTTEGRELQLVILCHGEG